METFNVYITAHPEAAGLLAVMLNDKVLASATTMEEALSYAGGYVDGWRKALSEAPRINGPQVNWGAVHAQQKEREDDEADCKRNGHRDTGRGVCATCGAFT